MSNFDIMKKLLAPVAIPALRAGAVALDPAVSKAWLQLASDSRATANSAHQFMNEAVTAWARSADLKGRW